jgi:hypothetical protein
VNYFQIHSSKRKKNGISEPNGLKKLLRKSRRKTRERTGPLGLKLKFVL